MLNDGRLASSSSDKSILIYNKDNYSVDLKIENSESEIFDIIQAKNGYIIAGLSTIGKILTYEIDSLTSYKNIQNIKAHSGSVKKILELKNGKIASCSDDKTIKIWNFSDNNLILEKTFDKYNTTGISNILELNNNIMVSCPDGNGSVIFWNMNNSEIIAEIKEINCNFCWNELKKLSEKIIIVGGEENIYLISVEKYNILNKYNINSGCYSICVFLNEIILTGHDNGYIRQYNLINDELKFLGEKKMHNDRIRVITLLKDNFIFSGSEDNKINIYKI